MAGYSTVTSKGQLVIPAGLRRKFGIRKGTRIAFLEDRGRLLLQPVTEKYIDLLRGCLKPGRSAFEAREADHKAERKA